MPNRLDRHRKTIKLMIHIYCKGNHGHDNLCGECSDILKYAEEKLIRCPFQKDKPVCSNCDIHCYRSDYNDKIKQIMRYSGRRILFKHPKYTLLYFKDKFTYSNTSLKDENNETSKRTKSTF